MNAPLLRLRGVSWRAGGRDVVAGLSCDVDAGEFVAVLGRNGAGKSTLVDLAVGLRTPATGAVEIDGVPIAVWTSSGRARAIAHLPQHVHVDLAATAGEIVLMGRYAHAAGWFESAADRRAADEAMRRCGCLAFAGRPMGTLSGGERQRVLLAACLAQQARLLLLDEPATFLDVDQQIESFGVLREEAARGAACVAVTHDVNLALRFCTRLIVVAAGAIAHDVDAAGALDRPGWLAAISGRLAPATTPGGRAWVAYR